MAKNSQLCAILSYLLIGIIWFFIDERLKKDKFAKFHVKQSIILLFAAIIWGIAMTILHAILPFLFVIWTIAGYVPLVFVILGIINALNMKEASLPIIGEYAKKLKF